MVCCWLLGRVLSVPAYGVPLASVVLSVVLVWVLTSLLCLLRVPCTLVLTILRVRGTRLVTSCDGPWAWFDFVGCVAVCLMWQRRMVVTLLVLLNLCVVMRCGSSVLIPRWPVLVWWSLVVSGLNVLDLTVSLVRLRASLEP